VHPRRVEHGPVAEFQLGDADAWELLHERELLLRFLRNLAWNPTVAVAEEGEEERPALVHLFEAEAPRVYRYAALPAGPSWAEVERVIAAASGDKPAEIRARALLLILAVYGLRCGEVVALRLEDFDWEREMLTVPSGKRQRPRIYPLCRSVGDAILRYLREARPPSTHREVFLRVRAPFHPMRGSTLTSLVRQRLLAAGVQSPHHGPHALRHACATHLLMQGLSLKEIGDQLGHHSPEATRTYAKVDLTALRSVADVDLEGLR